MIGLVVTILVSAALINGGDNGTDEFIAKQAWLYVSILGGATSSPAVSRSRAATSPTPTTTRLISQSASATTPPQTARPAVQSEGRAASSRPATRSEQAVG